MTETEACIALNMVPNLGPVRLRKLLEAFGTPAEILSARSGKLSQVSGVGPELSESIANWEKNVDLPTELQLIREFGASVVTQASPVYPKQLREIHNPPIVLYVWGDLQERDNHSVSVVGSRKTSHYGLDCAKKLSYQLCYAGLTVISGLARGIDTAAHQGALAAKGRTIAVIGSGFMDLYPAENQGLAEKIAASGAVVSEYPMKYPPSTQTFPYRNRIVAGWSTGLLVVEAGLNSGALITANQALEQGRLVYAVPGPIDRPSAAGSNRLIQQGAKLVASAGDILDDFNSLFPQSRAEKKPENASSEQSPLTSSGNSERPQLSPIEEAILAVLGSDEQPIDFLVSKTGLPAPKVSSTLLTLEMKRLVRQLPGQRFVKPS